MKRSKNYYTLLLFHTDTKKWGIEFGDYDREAVEDERDILFGHGDLLGLERPKTQIISTSDKQEEVDAKVEEINTLERAKKILKIAKEHYVENT